MSTSRYLGRDSSRRQMEIAENSRIYPSTANEKRREKKKRGKKEERRGLDSTDELYERTYIQGKLTGRYTIIRSLLGLLRRNNHRLPVIITVEREESNRRFVPQGDKKHRRGWNVRFR